MKKSELIHVPLQPVWQCTSIKRLGWKDGYLLIVFYGGEPDLHVFGPHVLEADAQKIAKNPFPNALFRKLLAKHGWQSTKIEA